MRVDCKPPERLRSSAIAGGFLLGVLLLACGPPPIPPAPEQPIAFSHAAHVADGELVCSRCHPGAESEKHAGLTPLRTCASCHRRTIPDHPEVQKLLAYWERQEPVLWQRVNFFPDSAMVHFNHGAHYRAGVECQECHGDHREMTVANPPINVANMGWCLECHRAREASLDCFTCHY